MPKKSGIVVIAVTGTPAVGKTKFAEALSKETGIAAVEVNDIVEKKMLFSGVDENGSKIVKMQELKKEINELEKQAAGSGQKAVILVGHLLADLKLDYDVTVVVRANLVELISRLEGRGYPKEKVKENLVSESIDYCGAQAAERSKETYEVEKEADKSAAIVYIKELLAGKTPNAPELPAINKMDEMLELVYEGNSYGL
jgi:broad-specificity NMP kinase